MNANSEKDEILGTIVHNIEIIQIAFNENDDRIYGFLTQRNNQIFEIVYGKLGEELKIHLIKVYTKKNTGLGTKALAYFEDWCLKKGVKKIIGELVNGPDSSSPAELKGFYLKNHYDVEDTGENYIYAIISKSLV